MVHADSWAPNAFFVLRSELPEGYIEKSTEELSDWGRFKAPLETGGKTRVRV